MTADRPIPRIFDRAQLLHRIARARRTGAATFLLERVVEDIGDRLAATLRPFPRMLDVATPTPLLAQALAARDSAQALTRLAPIHEPDTAGWTTIKLDNERLPVEGGSVDLAVSALALQWIDDLPGALVQIRRALAPDGLFLGCMIGGRSLQELRAVFATAEADLSGGASPRVAPFADLRDLGALLQRAGFALSVTDIDTVVVRYADIFALMRDLRAMGATNVLHQRSRTFLRRDILLRAADLYARDFADPDGRIRATFEIVWMSGWAPHESQQKPLQPGSARMRLSDVLPVKNYDREE